MQGTRQALLTELDSGSIFFQFEELSDGGVHVSAFKIGGQILPDIQPGGIEAFSFAQLADGTVGVSVIPKGGSQRTGPRAVVMAVKPDHVPIARPRDSSSKDALMIARLPGTRNAAPIP